MVATTATPATATPGDSYNLSPTSRTPAPTSVYWPVGSVSNPTNVLSHLATRLNGNGSAVTLDFGKEVGGIVTLSFSGASGNGQSVGLAFSESSMYVGNNSDNSACGTDGELRGGFRYLTLFLNSGGWVDVNGVSLAFSSAPGATDPSAYPNYFYSNDDPLNRIWYAGAYKDNPTSTVHPQDGNSLAVWYGVVPSATQADSVAAHLRTHWGSRGSQTPEWNNNISPFTGSMEVYAHLAAGDDTNALHCGNSVFGDPVVGTAKNCYVQ